MALSDLTRFAPADLGAKALGVAIAAASAAFPFYIHNNPDKFGPPRMQYAALDVQDGAAENRRSRFQEAAGSDAGSSDLDPVEVGATPGNHTPDDKTSISSIKGRMERPDLDGVMTGTIALPRLRKSAERQAPPEQPFPGDLEPVNLLFVSAGGALMMAEGGIEIIGEGSLLPDGSRVLSIRERDGIWEILTTGERVLIWRG
jgi:hypothetical protein